MEGPKEDKSGWSSFLGHLVNRGLSVLQLVISDAAGALLKVLPSFCPMRSGSAVWCISTAMLSAWFPPGKSAT